MRARINAREKLQRSDLSPGSSAQLQTLRPERAVSTLVPYSQTDAAIHE
jgi:hypothetical protein